MLFQMYVYFAPFVSIICYAEITIYYCGSKMR